MVKTPPSPTNIVSRAAARRPNATSTLRKLAQRFERFRRQHPLRTKFPHELRAAALAALGQGASSTELRRICGVTRRQAIAWTQVLAGPSTKRRRAPEVRVFAVIDEDTTAAPSTTGGELVLRVGRWWLSVRLGEGLLSREVERCFR